MVTEALRDENEPAALAKRDKAKEMFLSMDMPRIAHIARAVGVHEKQVQRWRDSENWLLERHERLLARIKKLEAIGCDDQQSVIEVLELCKLAKAQAKDCLIANGYEKSRYLKARDLRVIASIIADLAKVDADARKRFSC